MPSEESQRARESGSNRMPDLRSESRCARAVNTEAIDRIHEQLPSFELPHHSDESMDTVLQMDVRRARQLRLLRKRILGKEKSSGPGWDILLHLFDSHLSQLRDTVGSVCNGAELSSSSGVRWMSRLEGDELIVFTPDRLDGRRRHVELTDKGVRLMTSYFAGAAPHQITS